MRKFSCLLIVIISVIGCKKPYDPPAIASPGIYLVVEGVINPGTDSTTITLSKTVSLSSANNVNPVQGASVSVVSDQGLVYPLTAAGNGTYVSPGLNLDVTHQYRLSIKTADNQQYQSDLVPANITPAIDSVGFNVVSVPAPGVQIYASTHDATNTIKYYRWDYGETYIFTSAFISYYVSNGTTLVIRDGNQEVSVCYATDASSDIVLGSAAKLQQAVLYQSPIAFIPSTSYKIQTEYSILLHEYALTADAYNFWLNLKTNSEELGSIFDAQPSQITGNIHCITNPPEPVIGYVSISTVTSKRIFITKQQLPGWISVYPYNCMSLVGPGGIPSDTVRYGSPFFYSELVHDSLQYVDDGPPPSNGRTGYQIPGVIYVVPRYCADCTVMGTTTPPPFWPK
jgi:hypothetical protein